jgi:hypothetical protein
VLCSLASACNCLVALAFDVHVEIDRQKKIQFCKKKVKKNLRRKNSTQTMPTRAKDGFYSFWRDTFDGMKSLIARERGGEDCQTIGSDTTHQVAVGCHD